MVSAALASVQPGLGPRARECISHARGSVNHDLTSPGDSFLQTQDVPSPLHGRPFTNAGFTDAKDAGYRDQPNSVLFPGSAAPGGPKVAALPRLRVCGPFTTSRRWDCRRLRRPVSGSH